MKMVGQNDHGSDDEWMRGIDGPKGLAQGGDILRQ